MRITGVPCSISAGAQKVRLIVQESGMNSNKSSSKTESHESTSK